MQIPLTFRDISEWLAVMSIMLLIAAQLASAYKGTASILFNKKRLRTAALAMGILFLATVAIDIYGIITST
jgi:uncharacterized membrane protein